MASTTVIQKQMPQYTAQWVTPTGSLTTAAYDWLSTFASQNLEVSGKGFVINTGVSFLSRQIVPGSAAIEVTDGDGIKGNPTVDINQANLEILSKQISDSTIQAGSDLSGSSSGTNTGDQTLIGGTGIQIVQKDNTYTFNTHVGIPQVNIIYYTFFGGF